MNITDYRTILIAAESEKINELKGKTLDEFDDIIISNDYNEKFFL